MLHDWEIIKSSHRYIKEEAFRMKFNVPVKKDGTVIGR
ncbi:MAG: hypothetical protein ACI9E5_000765 [Candidatus Omnitrophota bacterium]|jgi:hypothetical protein